MNFDSKALGFSSRHVEWRTFLISRSLYEIYLRSRSCGDSGVTEGVMSQIIRSPLTGRTHRFLIFYNRFILSRVITKSVLAYIVSL